MPVYELLKNSYEFPPSTEAEANGLLAVGGDLSPERLLNAYAQGIFPWFSEPEPILWWTPAPRLVLYPTEIRVSKSMRALFRKGFFRITFDHAFAEVIRQCARVPRPGQQGTWITHEMQQAYIQLHHLGFAHSVETWKGDQLVGGLYGISLGKIFYGESMFTNQANASKYALIHLAHALQRLDFEVIDCQTRTEHLVSLGAQEIARSTFEQHLNQGLLHPSLVGYWSAIEALNSPPEV